MTGYVIIVIIIGIAYWASKTVLKSMKNGGCPGCSGGCSCSSKCSCHG